MGKIKKKFLVILTGLAGALMTLAGLGQIELSKDLILYTGVVLLALTILMYLTDGERSKKEAVPKEEGQEK